MVRFDGSGNMICDDNTTWETSGTDLAPPNGPSGITWTIDNSGVVKETGDSSSSTVHGNMASNKQLLVATVTLSTSDKAIRVLRKRVSGVMFSNSDIYWKSFTFHELDAGSPNEWNRGYGTFDGSGIMYANWFTSDNTSGTEGPYGPMAIDADGVVTVSGDPPFKGVMTADKSVIFATSTNASNYGFVVITLSGQTFAQSELAGTWRAFTLTSGTKANWLHGTLSMDATGAGTWTDVVSSEPETLGPVAWTLSAAGEIQDPANPSWSMFHGTMSAGKNLMCITASEGASEFGISLGVK